MAYQLSLDDFDAVDSQKGGYQLRPEDFDAVESPGSLRDVIFQGLRPQSAKEIPGQLSRLGRGALTGVLKAGRGFGELQAKGVRPIANFLGIPVAQSMDESYGSDRGTGIDRIFSSEVGKSAEGNVGEIGGEIAPYLINPGSATFKIGEKLIPYLYKELLKQSAILDVASVVSQPDKSIPGALKETYSNPITYAALGLGPFLTGARVGFSKLKKAYDTKGGTATADEALRNINAAGDTPVPLGEIINSPGLTAFQSSKLNYIPGAGLNKAYEKGGESIDNRLKAALGGMNTNPTGNIGQTGKAALQKARQEAELNNNMLWKDFENESESSNANVSLKNYTNNAKEVLEELKQKESGNPEYSNFQDKSYKQIRGFIKDISENDLNEKSFKNASLARADLNRQIDNADAEGNSYHVNILTGLKKSLEEDMENSAKAAKNPKIYQKYLSAKNDYAENVTPFMQGELSKYSHPISKADSDLFMQTFVKANRPNLLNKMAKYLSPDELHQLGHDYLMQGAREIAGKQEISNDNILTKYSKLSDPVKNTLFHSGKKTELDNILIARKLLGKNIHQMMSNATGEKVAKGSGIAAMSSLAGAGLASLLHGDIAGAALSGAGLVGLPLGGRYLKNSLLSDKWRNQYLKAVTQKRNPLKAPRSPLLSYAAYLAAQQDEDNQEAKK